MTTPSRGGPARRSFIGLSTAVLALAATFAVAPPAAAGAVPRTVLTNDFEDGTAQGWFGRGSAAVAASADTAHSGGASLLTTGRTANWNGPGRDLVGTLVTGATYLFEAYVRLPAGQPAVEINATMQRTPAGGSTTWERVAGAGIVTDAAWVPLRGEYTFTVDSTELQLYLESPDATASYHVDDVTITLIAEPPGGPPGQAGVRTDFEAGTAQGWAPRLSSETLTVTDADAHGGTRSLLTTGRTEPYAGPALNLLGRMDKGSTYTFSVWVKLAPGQDPARLRLSLERRLDGTPSYETLVADTTVTTDAWVRMTNQYTLAHDVDFLSVYVESAGGAPPFYLDDFELTWLEPLPIQTDIPSLREVFAGDFVLGTAIDRTETVGLQADLLRRHFNSITPGNALKWDATEPREGQFAWTEADAQVGFGVDNGIGVRGHTLVWHSQTPAWVFLDAEGEPLTNSAQDKALLLRRLEHHIRAVVGRYGDRVYAWDVVNEVVDEYQADGLRHSRWYEIAGLDYLRTAFRVAREVAPAGAKLYINDYNTELPRKRRAMFDLVSKLRAEGVPIDGVGHQMHIGVARPPIEYIEDTLALFGTIDGLDQQVTELDVSVYTNFTESYAQVPDEVVTAQGYQYRDVFDVFRRHADKLSSVTVWGLSDANTWLKNFPFPRLDLPLLFDERLQAKPAYWGLVDPGRLPALIRRLVVTRGSPSLDGRAELLWRLVPATPLIARDGGLAARVGTRWAANRLYVLVDVDDPVRDPGDHVDLFLDRDNGKTDTYGADDDRYRVTRTGYLPRGVTGQVRARAGGYTIEVGLPRLAGEVGGQVGFDVRITDGARPGQPLSWNDGRSAQDADTSRWGTLVLADQVRRVDAPRGTPTIDATVDQVWRRAATVTTGVQVAGAGGARATGRLLWDDGHLYVLVQVADPTLDESSPNAHEQDSVEIFLDPDNGKRQGYDDDDGQYRISFTNRRTVGGNFDGFAIADNLTSAARAVDGGYVIEAAIELDTITPAAGALLGFDLQVNDAAGGARTAAATWQDPTGLSYLNTSRWGVARLTDR